MTDDPVRTRITVDATDGTAELAMQEWFVRSAPQPPVVSVRFEGADTARPAPGVLDALDDGRHDRDLPVESGDLDRSDPRGARRPRRARRAGATGSSASRPIVGGAPVKGRPTGSWARSASRCRASASPARTRSSARRS